MTKKGDFLARVNRRLEGGLPENPRRPILEVPSSPIEYSADLSDLPGSFRTAARAVGTEVLETDQASLGPIVLDLLADMGPSAMVAASQEPVCDSITEQLTTEGIPVAEDLSPAELSGVALGITGAAAGVALTGSIVIDSSIPGARLVSLLPDTHLVILRRDDIVPTPGAFLRELGSAAHQLPSNIVLVTGPSRSADIELELTIGVHGPSRLVVALCS